MGKKLLLSCILFFYPSFVAIYKTEFDQVVFLSFIECFTLKQILLDAAAIELGHHDPETPHYTSSDQWVLTVN